MCGRGWLLSRVLVLVITQVSPLFLCCFHDLHSSTVRRQTQANILSEISAAFGIGRPKLSKTKNQIRISKRCSKDTDIETSQQNDRRLNDFNHSRLKLSGQVRILSRAPIPGRRENSQAPRCVQYKSNICSLLPPEVSKIHLFIHLG